jgi:hypothetical protein
MIHKMLIHFTEMTRVPGSPLHIDCQDASWYVWYLVQPKTHYDVVVIGTGAVMEFDFKDWHYLNTFLQLNGRFVWHAFSRLVVEDI